MHPDEALNYYLLDLEREYIAQENGYGSWDEYYNAKQDDIENQQTGEYLGK